MSITFVKKIKMDGTPCRKCAEVATRLETAGLMGRIDRTVLADERDPDSEGMRLAAALGVHEAPFFIVTPANAATVSGGGASEAGAAGAGTVYTSYVKLLKEVLAARPSEEDEAREILENNRDLDVF